MLTGLTPHDGPHARSCGIAKTATVRTPDEAEQAVARAMTEPGPWVLVAKVEAEGDTDTTYAINSPDVIDQAVAFYRFLRSQEVMTP